MFLVLQTAVTRACKRLGDLHSECAHAAGCAVDEDVLAGRTLPLSRRPCSAVMPAMGTDAACSQVRFSGLRARVDWEAQTYSAKEPLAVPKTASPALKLVTLRPTASTTPATSAPRRLRFWRAQAGEEANEGRRAADEVPVVGVDGGCADLDEYLIVSGYGLFDAPHSRRTSGGP